MSLVLKGVSKRFGETQALAGVDLTLTPGKIHSLVGENGAGKSTALGALGGRVQPDSGRVLLDGQDIKFATPRQAMACGIKTIYQELSVIPNLTVVENVFIGQGRQQIWLSTKRKAQLAPFDELASSLGLVMDPLAITGNLSIADQQLVEILRAMVGSPRAVLFDEPSASLGPNERESLYRVLELLRERGVMVGLVSHNLQEVLALSDQITVFRDGHLVRTGPSSRWSHDSLTKAMVGDIVETRGPRIEPDLGEDPTLCVEGMAVGDKLAGINLSVSPGEILGVAGLVGSGRSTLLRALAGDLRPREGDFAFDGQKRNFPRSIRSARRLGITYVSEDRKLNGLIPDLSASLNIVLGDLGAVSRVGVLSKSRIAAAAADAASQVAFKEDRLETSTVSLSGGNQQKVLIARAIHSRPRVLLVDEPTRGVDIGAKAEIHKTLETAAGQGAAVIVVSSEFEDLVKLCDRIVVMWNGGIVAELVGDEMSIDLIVKKSFGPEVGA